MTMREAASEVHRINCLREGVRCWREPTEDVAFAALWQRPQSQLVGALGGPPCLSAQGLKGVQQCIPNSQVYMLMGDVAIQALNYIARRAGEDRVIPSGTCDIRRATVSYVGRPIVRF